MRIAVYHNLTSGGAKRALHEHIRRMHPRHLVDVFTLESANHDFADLRPYVNNYHIHPFQPLALFDSPFGRLNQVIRYLNLKRLEKIAAQMARMIEAGSYDVVYVHPCQFWNSPPLLRHLPRAKTVFYCQEPLRIAYETMPGRPYDLDPSGRRQLLNRIDPLPGFYQSFLRRNEKRNIHQAGRVLVNSEFIRSSVRQIYQLEAQTCYLGVDAEKFKPLQTAKEGFVLSVGSLTPLKGFDFLIQAVAEIPAHERPELVIASNFQNPPEKAFLEALALEKAVHLRLSGNVSDEDLVALYHRAAVTVYAPVREPFGFVSLESMACETPIIAVREGGIQETVLHAKTGLLVERDPKIFAEALRSLLSTPERANQFGKAGRAHVLEQWTWERSTERLEGFLSQAAQSG